VFRGESTASLHQALIHYLQHGPLTADARLRIRKWSHCIGGETVARYLVAVLEHVYAGGARPVPPWRESAETGNAFPKQDERGC